MSSEDKNRQVYGVRAGGERRALLATGVRPLRWGRWGTEHCSWQSGAECCAQASGLSAGTAPGSPAGSAALAWAPGRAPGTASPVACNPGLHFLPFALFLAAKDTSLWPWKWERSSESSNPHGGRREVSFGNHCAELCGYLTSRSRHHRSAAPVSAARG